MCGKSCSEPPFHINHVIEQLCLPELALPVQHIVELGVFDFHRNGAALSGPVPNARHTRQRHVHDAIRAERAVCDEAHFAAAFQQNQIAHAPQRIAPGYAEQDQP